MVTKPANAVQKKWMSDIAEWANDNLVHLFPDYRGEGFQLHHVIGRSAKHNKVAIGHEFILPIPFDLHDVNSNHELNVTHHKHSFTNAFGTQRSLFEKMCISMECYGYKTLELKTYLAIMGTRA